MTTLRKALIVPAVAALFLAAPQPAEAAGAQVASVAVDVHTVLGSPYQFVVTAEAVIVPGGLSYTPVAVGSCQAVILPLPPSDANVSCWVEDEQTGATIPIVDTSIDAGDPVLGVTSVQYGVGISGPISPEHNLNLCVQAEADGWTTTVECSNFLLRGLPG